MCRHLAHLGPPATLAALLLDPSHGLLHQSYAPADMRGGGTVNADGFGAGWYPPAVAGAQVGAADRERAAGVAACGASVAAEHASDPPTAAEAGERAPGRAPLSDPSAAPHQAVAGEAGRPVRYRSDRPIWADPGFAAFAAVTPALAVLAAVRSATPAMPVTATAAAPFAEGRWLFSHNGVIRGWPHSVAGLAAQLPVTDLLTLDAPTDSALLWALVRHRLRAGDDPAAVLAGVVRAVDSAAPGSRLNLLLTDGAAIWATTWTHALSVRAQASAVTVASEPSDPGEGWAPIPDEHLVVATRQQCRVRPLDAAVSPAGMPAA